MSNLSCFAGRRTFHHDRGYVCSYCGLANRRSAEASNSATDGFVRLNLEIVRLTGLQIVDFYLVFSASIRSFGKLVEVVRIHTVHHATTGGSVRVPYNSGGALVGSLNHG